MDKKWNRLNADLVKKDSTYKEPNLPFQDHILIRDFNHLYAKIYDKEKFIQA